MKDFSVIVYRGEGFDFRYSGHKFAILAEADLPDEEITEVKVASIALTDGSRGPSWAPCYPNIPPVGTFKWAIGYGLIEIWQEGREMYLWTWGAYARGGYGYPNLAVNDAVCAQRLFLPPVIAAAQAAGMTGFIVRCRTKNQEQAEELQNYLGSLGIPYKADQIHEKLTEYVFSIQI